MPLWHSNYFELKAVEKKWTQEKLHLPPICLKGGHIFTKASLLPSVPGRTKVNPWRQL